MQNRKFGISYRTLERVSFKGGAQTSLSRVLPFNCEIFKYGAWHRSWWYREWNGLSKML